MSLMTALLMALVCPSIIYYCQIWVDGYFLPEGVSTKWLKSWENSKYVDSGILVQGMAEIGDFDPTQGPCLIGVRVYDSQNVDSWFIECVF